MKLQYSATLHEGDLHISGYKQLLAEIQAEGWQDLIITVEKRGRKRSDRQRRFYWGAFVVSQIECFKEQYGTTFSKEIIHQWNHQCFFYQEIANINTGEIERMPRSTNDYTPFQFEEKLQEIRDKFWSAWEWELPIPNEQMKLEV